MKFLDAKRSKTPLENKMASGPTADKSEPSTSERAPAVSGFNPMEKEPDATPSAARLAAELGVDLALVKGSGSGGRITVEDVRNAVEATKAKDQTPGPSDSDETTES